MSTVSRDDIIKLAALSSLKLKDDEIDGLRSDIDMILSYVEQLNELDTKDVVPAYQVTGLTNVFRSDDVSNGSVSREKLLALAPNHQDNQVKVPKVL